MEVNIQTDEIQYIPDTGSPVAIQHTSSTIKALTFLFFYLSYDSVKSDFVIIDEPELSLHPDNQVLVARLIARMVNEGLKVMISTHSDNVIREINNLIMVKEKIDQGETSSDLFNSLKPAALDRKKMQALYFSPDNTARSLLIDETGFEVESIDETIDQLNDRSRELYYELKSQNNE